MEHDDTRTVSNSQMDRADTESLSQFFTAPLETPMESEKQSETPTLQPLVETPPRPGQKYWLSAEARQKKRLYMNEYNAKKKEEIRYLKEHQLQARTLTLLDLNGKLIVRHLDTDADYVKILEDVVGTLVDNRLLKDFSLNKS